MTIDERRMVGHLLDLGVPISQIKTAVGRNVTQKDLHNVKNQMKAVKMGLQEEEDKPIVKQESSQNQQKMSTDSEEEICSIEIPEAVKESRYCMNGETATNDMTTIDNQSFINESQSQVSVQEIAATDVVDKTQSNDSQHFFNPENPSAVIVGSVLEEKECELGEMNGLSGLLAAAGSVDALDTNPGFNDDDHSKTSYTVVVSSNGNMEMSQTSANLQELLKKVGFERVLKSKRADGNKGDVKMDATNKVDHKNCENCGKYMSPLDGHNLCILCLGPQHLHSHDCEHCATMKPEQLNIRRKVFVKSRMKALKQMNDTKRQYAQSFNEDDQVVQARRSKRARKPKNFGPEMAVHTLLGQRLVTPKTPTCSKSKITTCVVNDGEKEYVVEIPKREPDDGYDYTNSSFYDNEKLKLPGKNTLRFDHLLKQTEVLEDVLLIQGSNGTLEYSPDSEVTEELSKVELHSDVPGVPSSLEGKYSLNKDFEANYCSIPMLMEPTADSTIVTMNSNLHKLAQNAVMQTRLAVYDKLFTKLGEGMADEALNILSQLCGKVTQVTEISQEDLTNDLQTALDTIQALKDVLQELGVMSKDALSTAAHQRKISVTSLQNAKKSVKTAIASTDTQPPAKRRKFQPFTQTKVVSQSPIQLNTSLVKSLVDSEDDHVVVKEEHFAPPETNNAVMMNAQSIAPVITVDVPSTEISENSNVTDIPTTTTFIDVSNKQYTIAPAMALSGELLETLQSQKDGIIELHVVKNDENLVVSQAGSIVHEVIQSPSLEMAVDEGPSVDCE